MKFLLTSTDKCVMCPLFIPNLTKTLEATYKKYLEKDYVMYCNYINENEAIWPKCLSE